MGQLGMTNPDSNPGDEMELAAGGLGTLHQLGPLDRAACSKFTSNTRPNIINMQHKMNRGKRIQRWHVKEEVLLTAVKQSHTSGYQTQGKGYRILGYL